MDVSIALKNLNWLAIIVAALAPFLIGGLWYGPLFQKEWMALTGLTKETPGQNPIPLVFGMSFVLNLVIATTLGLFIGGGDWRFGLFTGFLAGFMLVGMAFGIVYLFESRPLKLWCINAGYQTVVFTVMGAIIGAWH